MSISAGESQQQHQHQQTIQLDVSDGSGRTPSRLALSGRHLLIGRSPDAQVHLDRATVSRRHAEITCDPFRRWWVRDLGSRNHTYVNGQLVEEHPLRPGDSLGVGEFTLRVVSLADAPTPVSVAPAPHQQEWATTCVSVAVEPAGTGQDVSRLTEMVPPRIAASHVSALNEFGQQLLRTDAPQERLALLCRLMVRREFHGRWAATLRVRKDQAGAPTAGSAARSQPDAFGSGAGSGAVALCPTAAAEGWENRPMYVSQSVLKALLEKEDPVLASNLPALHNDAAAAQISISPAQMAIAALAAPIRADDGVLDLLYVVMPPECGTGEWLALAALATKQYQQAEEVWAGRAQREAHVAVERELAQARQIQMRLVPTPPSVPGLDLAVGFKPCRWVGGDYVDIVRAADGRLLLTLADVCGKGLSAAMLASSLHTTIRMAVRTGLDLPSLARNLNEHLLETMRNQTFVTMVCALLEPATGRVEFVNAGHPPPMILDGAGGLRELCAEPNFPLGIVAGETFAPCQDQLRAGDLLVFYSDGITDVTNPEGEHLGTEGLREQLRTLWSAGAALPAAELAERFNRALDAVQAESLPMDDRTFLMVKKA
jgi:phosphoserine phosphatase RsbU/P